jgi:ubiquinone/menaquinone biosynthesis C-methylase UbiE
MSLVEALHGGFVFPRRVRILAERLAPRIPEGARTLDLGCGDGRIGAAVKAARPDVDVRGADVLERPKTFVEVDVFDGKTLPYADRTFDAVMLVDVLHHTDDPAGALKEARRVCRGSILIKDHLADPWLGRARLKLMDRVGNARHGVALTYNYLDRRAWRALFREVGLTEVSWDEKLRLYPAAMRWLFEDSLHFLAELKAAA